MKNPIARYLMCAYAYYEENTNLITDAEFDQLAKDILANYDNIASNNFIFYLLSINLSKS